MAGYDFHPEARLDLDEIWEFIRTDNLDAADRLIMEILSAIDAVVQFPDQGHRRPDLTSRPLRYGAELLDRLCAQRKAFVGRSLIHGRRDPRIMAAMLKGRV